MRWPTPDPTALVPVVRPAQPQDHGDRRNTPIDTLVLHTTEGGSAAGALAWWDREDVIASAHYVIDGRQVVQRVPEGLAAYHAGNAALNRRSIGIEVVGHSGRPGTWTPAVMGQLLALSAELVRRHAIPVVRQAGPGICGHCDVPHPRHQARRGGASGHTDPGPPLPVARVPRRARGAPRAAPASGTGFPGVVHPAGLTPAPRRVHGVVPHPPMPLRGKMFLALLFLATFALPLLALGQYPGDHRGGPLRPIRRGRHARGLARARRSGARSSAPSERPSLGLELANSFAQTLLCRRAFRTPEVIGAGGALVATNTSLGLWQSAETGRQRPGVIAVAGVGHRASSKSRTLR